MLSQYQKWLWHLMISSHDAIFHMSFWLTACYLFPVWSLFLPQWGSKLLRFIFIYQFLGLPWWLSGKEHTCQCRRCGFYPWVGKVLWRRKWQPTPVFLPGESHGQDSLSCYSPWGRKRVGLDLATKQQQAAPKHRLPAGASAKTKPTSGGAVYLLQNPQDASGV